MQGFMGKNLIKIACFKALEFETVNKSGRYLFKKCSVQTETSSIFIFFQQKAETFMSTQSFSKI